MDEARRRRLLQDLFQEAMEDIYSTPTAKPRAKAIKPCGCESECGDVSTHDEDTVLVGVVLDA